MERTTDARKTLRGLFLAVGMAGLSACGGGDSPPPSPPAPPAKDFSVDPFSIAAVSNAAPESAVLSTAVVLKGFNQPLNIHVENGEYCLNQDPEAEEITCSSTDGQVSVNDKLMLRATSSAEAGATVSMSVAIGNDNASVFGTDFFVTTRTLATLPDNEVVLAPVAGATAGMTVSSDPVVVDGFNGAITASVTSGAMISVDGAAPVAGPVVIVAGQSVAIITTVPDDAEGTHAVTLELSDGENEAVSTFNVALRNSESVIEALPVVAPQEGIEPGADFEFEPVTIGGDFATAPIRITGGEYRVNDGQFTTLEGIVSPGDEITVRVVALEEFSRSHFARLTVGGGEHATTTEFKVVTEAEPEGLNRPDPFKLGSELGLQPGTEVTSIPVTLTGFTGELPLAIAADGVNVLVAVNDGEFGAAPATVSSGAILRLKLIALEAFGTEFTVDVHVGAEGEARQTGTWWLSTRTQDLSPTPFGFGTRTGLEPSSEVTSQPVTVSGFEGELPVTIAAPAAAQAAFRIGEGSFSTTGNIKAGQTLTVRAKAPGATATSAHTISVTVGDPENGGQTGTFVLQSADIEPSAFTFTQPAGDVEPGLIIDAAAVVTGFGLPLPVSIPVVEGTDLAEVSVAGSEFTSETDGLTISAGQVLKVRIRTSSNPDGNAHAMVRVGEGATAKEAIFAATTRDFQPDAFTFATETNGIPDAFEDQTVELTGFEGALVAHLDNALFFADDSVVKTVTAGESVTIKVKAPAAIGDSAIGALHLGLTAESLPLASGTFEVQAADHEPPTVTVQYPTQKSLTNDDVVLVRGTYSDNHAIDYVTVAGVTAELLDETHWQAEVPLDAGPNPLSVTAIDTYSNTAGPPLHTIISERERFTSPTHFAVSSNGNIAFVANAVAEGGLVQLIRLDLQSGTQSVFGEYTDIHALALGQGMSRLYAAVQTGSESPMVIAAINLIDKSIEPLAQLSENQQVVSINFDVSPGAIAGTEDDWERLFVVIAETDSDTSEVTYGLHGIELGAAGGLLTLSKPGVQGGNEVWSEISDVVFDHSRNAAYVTGFDDGVLYEVSGIESDTRWSIKGSTGPGDRAIETGGLGTPSSLLLNETLGEVFVLDTTNREVLKISIGTSNSTPVSNADSGGFVDPVEIAVGVDDSILMLDTSNTNGLVSIDLAAGGVGTTVPDTTSIGSGEAMRGSQIIMHGQDVYFREGSSTIRSFSVANGHRGNVQYNAPASTPLRDLDAVGDDLWGLLQGGTVGSLVWSAGTFNTSSSGNWVFELKHTFSNAEGVDGNNVLGGGMVIDGDTAYLLTRDGAGFNRIYAETMGDPASVPTLASIFESGINDTLVGFGQLSSNLFYVVTKTRVWAINTIQPFNSNAVPISTGFVDLTEVVKLDDGRLAVWDEGTDKLMILHIDSSNGDVGVFKLETVIDMNLTEDPDHPYRGYSPSALRGLAYDAENQHLLGLNASGREVIVIDLGKITLDGPEPGEDTFEVTSGQSLLISRGGQ